MSDFDGPPFDERGTSDGEQSDRLDFDTLVRVAEMINGIFVGRGLQLMIELEQPPVLATEEAVELEKERLYQRAGELAIGEDIKIGINILMDEARLHDQ